MTTHQRDHKVRRLVHHLGANYGWSSERCARLIKPWATPLDRYAEEELMDAATVYIATQDHMPKLNQLLAVLSDQPITRSDGDGCADCDHTGRRHMSVHYMDRRSEVMRYLTCAAACDCGKGRALSLKPYPEVASLWLAAPNYRAHHVTDRHSPTLSMTQQLGPERAEALSERRVKAAPSGWAKVEATPTSDGHTGG